MNLTPEELQLANTSQVPTRILGFIRTHSAGYLAPLTMLDEEFEPTPTPGVLLTVEKEDAPSLIHTLRDGLGEHGYRVWYYGPGTTEENILLTIVPTDDPYLLLQLKGTNGLNYGLETEDIIATLRSWESLGKFHIIQASFNSVELLFAELPANPEEFLEEEVRPFCYDFGTQAQLGEESILEGFTTHKKLVLWWD